MRQRNECNLTPRERGPESLVYRTLQRIYIYTHVYNTNKFYISYLKYKMIVFITLGQEFWALQVFKMIHLTRKAIDDAPHFLEEYKQKRYASPRKDPIHAQRSHQILGIRH